MPGWIVQWYVNVPAALMVTGELVAPALSVPVWNRPLSCVESCAVESALCHATDWPTRIVVGFGLYELLPRSPWI